MKFNVHGGFLLLGAILLANMFAGCATETVETAVPQWKPIGQRKARVVHWGIIHNHSKGKWDAVLKLTNDYEMVGWVDDRASTAMRMREPGVGIYTNYPCFTPQQVFDEVKPDLIVVETANSDLVEVSTEIARHGIPMHMDKPLGIDQIGYRKMSRICEARGIPLQIGYMFRSNEAINKMVEIARSGIIGDVYSVDADLDHSYGYPKYPEYASHYPGGTAYLLACHVIEWAMPIFDDAIPLKTWSILKPAPGDPEWALTHSLTVMEYPRANVTIRVCSRGTQPCRHIRIDGTNGSMKHDLGLRPVYHQLDDRLEAHIFTSFIAFCLLTTLRAMARKHAPGLTPRQIIANLKTIKMVDVVMPTTDGRVVTLPRHVEPKDDVALLLNRLGLTLPDQPPPKISESQSAT